MLFKVSFVFTAAPPVPRNISPASDTTALGWQSTSAQFQLENNTPFMLQRLQKHTHDVIVHFQCWGWKEPHIAEIVFNEKGWH